MKHQSKNSRLALQGFLYIVSHLFNAKGVSSLKLTEL